MTMREHLDQLAKPPGSLGRLEDLAVRLSEIQRTTFIRSKPRRLVLFAADHGVVAEGVSAWPAAVTTAMMNTISSGRAASTVLCACNDTDWRLVDVGSLSGTANRCINRRIRAGTRNLAVEPAMTDEEFVRALAVGAAEAELAGREGMAVVIGGEMGIGNSTSAACLATMLADVPLPIAVGRGAGADDATLQRKQQVVAKAVARARSPACVAGYEIVALAGFFHRAGELGLTIILDGFIATAGALIAEWLAPGSSRSMIAAHVSAEPGHEGMLRRLGLEPILTGWNLRLGEGTGALLVLPMLDAACAVVREMATLSQIGAK